MNYQMKINKLVSIEQEEFKDFFYNPFHVAEPFTGVKGELVDIKDTIKGFNMIMDGELDHLPESAFNLKGTIDQVIIAGEKLLEEVK